MWNCFPLARFVRQITVHKAHIPWSHHCTHRKGEISWRSDDSPTNPNLDICFSYSICGWSKTLFLGLEFSRRTEACLQWATPVEEKWKVKHYCCKPRWIRFKCMIWVIFFILPRDTGPVFSFPLSNSQKSDAPNTHLWTDSSSSHTPKGQRHPNWFGNETVQLRGPVENAWRGCPDVVMSFLNLAAHETLRTPHCAKSAPCGPWQHPWPLPCRWLTGSPPDRLSKINSPSLPLRSFLEKTSLLQFYKQGTHVIRSSNWTSLEANGRGTGWDEEGITDWFIDGQDV